MSWLDRIAPARMRRIAIVAPDPALRDVLVQVADAGTVEIAFADGTPIAEAATVAAFSAKAVRRSGAAALPGWTPASQVPALSARVSGAGGAVVPLPYPRGIEPPSLPAGRPLRLSLSPLVQTYGTVPYPDVDPSWLAWGSYVLMFGMMFGDVGEGAVLLLVALALRASSSRPSLNRLGLSRLGLGWLSLGWLARFRAAWPFVAGAGAASAICGLLYGECFGPTGLVPALWLDPLDDPVRLLLVAAGVGAVLLAGAYLLGVVNRWREGGLPAALYASSGIAGGTLFGGVALLAGGWRLHWTALLAVGAMLTVAALVLAFTGFLATAGGGGAGRVQASVELFDLVVRLGSNVVSFTRLAAFGLTHAALGLLVWEGTRSLWHRGGGLTVLAVVVFVTGTALAFALEALVAAIQALRLEYYELFSRVFVTQGRPFRPWHLPAAGEPAETTSGRTDVRAVAAERRTEEEP